jgi:hypothetical protein
MAIHEIRASGMEYLALATELLQRARLADAEARLWEAADRERARAPAVGKEPFLAVPLRLSVATPFPVRAFGEIPD